MIVYLITNLVNGKRYVGQTTVSMKARWQQHQKTARFGKRCAPLQYAIRRYGHEKFTIELIDELPTGSMQQDLDRAETAAIQKFGSLSPAGYNLRGGGAGGRLHEETKAKLSASAKKRFENPANRASLGEAIRAVWAAHPEKLRTPARRNRSRRAGVGKKRSPMQVEAMRQRVRAQMANPLQRQALSISAKQRMASTEARERIAAALRGRKASPETCAKRSAMQKGKPLPYLNNPAATAKRLELQRQRGCSAETRAKLSAASKNISAETRAKMSASARTKPPVSKETRERMRLAAMGNTNRQKKAVAWAS